MLALSFIATWPWTLGFEVSEGSCGGPTVSQGCLERVIASYFEVALK